MNGNNLDDQHSAHVRSELIGIPLPGSQCGQVNRNELIRLLADGLRDLGCHSAAKSLEDESGVPSSSHSASEFLALLASKQFDAALSLLDRLPFKEGTIGRKRAKNFIIQERYLDCLIHERLEEAISRLHEELYYLNHEDEADLDELAAMLACPTSEDLRKVSGKLRLRQAKRFCSSTTSDAVWGEDRTLIDCIRILLDSEAVVPPQRLLHLLGQALALQAGEHGDLRRLEGQPLPLLRDVHEIEEERKAMLLPSAQGVRVIPITGRRGPVEVWCVCVEDEAGSPRIAAGTKEGSIIILESESGVILETLDRVFGRHGQPIVSMDWASPFGLLAVSRDNGNRRRQRHASTREDSDEEMREDGSHGDDNNEDEDEDHINDNGCLVRVVFPTRRQLQTPRMAYHMGRPCARWLDNGGLVTGGVDGWLRIWTANELQLSSSTKVERILDMVTFPDRTGVFVACADNTVKAYRGVELVFSTLHCPDPIVSLACGFNSLAASLRNQSILVWNLKDILQSRQGQFFPGSPPTVFKGFARKRFVLRPSVGSGDFIATGSEDGDVHIFSCFGSTTGSSATEEVLILEGHSAVVNDVCFAPKVPALLVSAGDDGSMGVTETFARLNIITTDLNV